MPDRIIPLYECEAAAWDRDRGRDLIEKPWLDRFAALLPPGGTILDLGCGMGEPIARHLIERGCSLTGLDSAPSLIEMCRTRFPDHRWLVGDMRELALGTRFGGIIAWHSFIHLAPDDQLPMFPRLADHLTPGGALMFTSGPEHGEQIGKWRGAPLYHGSLGPEEYRTLLEQNGFETVAHSLRDDSCGCATVWLARLGG